MSTLKVVHVETGRYLYGGARQVLHLLEHLPALGVESLLVCSRGAEIAERGRALDVRVVELSMRGDLDLPFAFRLAALLRRERPDLVHVHSRRGADVWGGLAARMAGVPAVLTRRVDNPESALAVRLKYPLYAQIVAITEAVQQVLVGNGVPADRIAVVHSAIDPAPYRQHASRAELVAAFGLDPGAPVLGIAAQLIGRKGHGYLFEALQQLEQRHPSVQLLVFGRGPLEAELRAQAQALGLDGRVHFLGFRDDLGHWLGALDLLVHPALAEGMGVTLLQAAASGTAVIASRAGGIPEAVADGQTGLLVPPADVAALAAAIDRLLDDADLRQRLGAAGPAFVEAGFTASRMAAGNRAIYRRLLGR